MASILGLTPVQYARVARDLKAGESARGAASDHGFVIEEIARYGPEASARALELRERLRAEGTAKDGE